MPGQGLADEAFEAHFRCVGGHVIKYPSSKLQIYKSLK